MGATFDEPATSRRRGNTLKDSDAPLENAFGRRRDDARGRLGRGTAVHTLDAICGALAPLS